MRNAPTALVLFACAALAGCDKEPDFDARYDAAEKQIARTADEIEAQAQASGAPTALPSEEGQ